MSKLANRYYFGFGDWKDVIGQFYAGKIPEPKYVYAVYSTPAYSGSATVIFKQGRKWFEASGGHCSCYGLEDQWGPQEINPRDHLKAVKEGKKILLVADTEGDYPEATQEHFDKWLAQVTKQKKKKPAVYPDSCECDAKDRRTCIQACKPIKEVIVKKKKPVKNPKFLVIETESERGWGSKDIGCVGYASKEAADKAAKAVNDLNKEDSAPDYYIYARVVDVLDITPRQLESYLKL